MDVSGGCDEVAAAAVVPVRLVEGSGEACSGENTESESDSVPETGAVCEDGFFRHDDSRKQTG